MYEKEGIFQTVKTPFPYNENLEFSQCQKSNGVVANTWSDRMNHSYSRMTLFSIVVSNVKNARLNYSAAAPWDKVIPEAFRSHENSLTSQGKGVNL